MRRYIADTNIFVRLFLQDNREQFKKSQFYLHQAKNGKIEIEVLSETIFEIEYTLRKFYELDRRTISKWLSTLIKTNYLRIAERASWARVWEIYPEVKFDLVDIFLSEKAKEKQVEVLSFDKDFQKLKKLK